MQLNKNVYNNYYFNLFFIIDMNVYITNIAFIKEKRFKEYESFYQYLMDYLHVTFSPSLISDFQFMFYECKLDDYNCFKNVIEDAPKKNITRIVASISYLFYFYLYIYKCIYFLNHYSLIIFLKMYLR